MSHNSLYDHAKWITLEADMTKRALESAKNEINDQVLLDKMKTALELVRHVRYQMAFLHGYEASEDGDSKS